MKKTTNLVKILVEGLFYPAVLGTVFVLFLYRITANEDVSKALSDCALYWGVVLILYFSASYIMMKDRDYNGWALLIDMLETLLIFIAYYNLGYFDSPQPALANWTFFYLLMAPIPFLHQVWNKVIDYPITSKHMVPATLSTVVFIIGVIWNDMYWWINYSLCFLHLVLLSTYIYKLPVLIELKSS